jgi:Protein of unknown function (DUF1569)
MPVNTAKVQGRRSVDYASFDELLADAERMSSGSVKALGNWSVGQIYKHIAIVVNGSIDGLDVTFPWLFRKVARLFKRKLLSGSMPSGFQIKPHNEKVLVPGPTSTEEGLADLRAAIARVQRESYRAPHPMFGTLTKEEWDKLNLKHASMHMSFLVLA